MQTQSHKYNLKLTQREYELALELGELLDCPLADVLREGLYLVAAIAEAAKEGDQMAVIREGRILRGLSSLRIDAALRRWRIVSQAAPNPLPPSPPPATDGEDPSGGPEPAPDRQRPSPG